MNDYCIGCDYRGEVGGDHVCLYILHTGHKRPCPPGKGCTEHTKRNPTQRNRIDQARAAELHAAGASDVRIASEFGVSLSAVSQWRKKHALPNNQKSKEDPSMRKKTEPTPETPSEQLPQEPAQANPVTEEPRPISLDKFAELIQRCRAGGLGAARISIDERQIEDVYRISIERNEGLLVLDLKTKET